MKHPETQYLDILKDIMDNGTWKDAARPGMPRTKEVFFRTMQFDLSKGYPLFTTKKMAWKTMFTELTWFLKGDTNIKYLLENGCNIWTDDAYKYYVRKCKDSEPLSKEDWKEKVLAGEAQHQISRYIGDKQIFDVKIPYGECGKIYGAQWRKYGINEFDQVEHLINNIKNNPNSRYHIINAWNGDDFLGEFADVALPACHVYYQFCVNNGKLDMMMVQRSCDMFLGVPFNIASGAALLMIIAKHAGYEPGTFNWVGNCCHIYENHFEQVEELLTREPYYFPILMFDKKENIWDYTKDDFKLIDYESHPQLKAPLSVGV